MAVSAGELDDDRALVYAVQQGDTEAYSSLFRRHYPAVRRACARRLGNMVEADEVAQAAFVRALERIEQCQGERRFGPWVHVIARYQCIDAIRARAKVTPEEDPVPESRSGGGLPEDGILDRERHRNVHLALAQLPERQRDVVIARTFENRRPVEIAASLGLSVAAVDSLLLRARRGLALAYERVAGEGGAAATITSASAASALGGTMAVGPSRVVEGMASAGQAITSAAGDVASTAAASIPQVRGIGAGVASAVMAASLALTGSVPSSPVDTPPASVVPASAPVDGSTLPLGTPLTGLPTLIPPPLGAADGVGADRVLGGSLFGDGGLVGPLLGGSTAPKDRREAKADAAGGGVPSAAPALADLGRTVDELTSSLVPAPVRPPAPPSTDGSSAGSLPAPNAAPVLPGIARAPIPEVAGTVTGVVDDVTGTVGRSLGGSLPSVTDAAPVLEQTVTTLVSPEPEPGGKEGSGNKSGERSKTRRPPAPAAGITGAVGDLLR